MTTHKKYNFYNYHKLSNYSYENKKSDEPPTDESWPDSWKKIQFKRYPRFEKVQLDKDVWDLDSWQIVGLLLKRESSRNTSKSSLITLKQLSFLLLSCAIRIQGSNVNYSSKRTYPSAGARFPLEVYILIRKSSDIKVGFYHFDVKNNLLEFLWDISNDTLNELSPSQSNLITEASCLFIISGKVNRSAIKYGERAYRFALLEAGHLAQNICLLSCSLELNNCPIGGFDDMKVSKVLDLDDNELPLYLISIF